MAIQTPPGWLQNAGSTHTAAQLRQYIAGLVAGNYSSATGLRARGGIHPSLGEEFRTHQAGSPNMTVLVEPGVACIPGTESGTQANYWAYTNAQVTLSITAAHASLPRIDIVVVNVRDTFYSGSFNDAQLQVIAGTPASSPVAPAAPANSITICQVAVGAAVTSIVDANITDLRFYLAAVGGIINIRTLSAAPAAAEMVEGQLLWTMDTNRLYLYDGTNTTQIYPTSGLDIFKHKTADESVTSSTTFQDDDHLVLPYAAGTTYILEGWLPQEGPTAGDWKMQFTFTGGTVTRFDFSSFGLGDGATAAEGNYKGVAQLGATTSPSAGATQGTITSNWTPILLHGLLITSGAGTLTLQWAQNASNASAVILKKGGWIRLTPVPN